MSILDRKPKKYNTSDLFWEPSPAPDDGAVGDINTMRLDPSHLGFAQDVIIDASGILRSRGGTFTVTTDTFPTNTLVQSIVVQGGTGLILNTPGFDSLLMAVNSTTSLNGFALLTAATMISVATTNAFCPGVKTHTIAKLADNTGALIASDYGHIAQASGQTSIWGGNLVTTSDTTAGSAAATVGSKAVVGVGTAWTTALEGTFLFIGATLSALYVGKVKTVSSTTTLTLERGARTTFTSTPNFKCVRPIEHLVYKGRITTVVGVNVVVGAGTKFASSGPLGSGASFLTAAGHNIFRASDGAHVGLVSSVQNDTTLTLNANAAIAMANEEYYINQTNFTMGANGPDQMVYGSGVARFADRYWLGGINAKDDVIKASNVNFALAFSAPNSLAFSKKNEPEMYDLDPANGDILALPTGSNNDRIRGLCTTRGGLVVFRTHDTQLITGYSPETFRAIKIIDDGIALSTCFKEFKEGVVWVGFKSIYYFDGTRVVDLLENKIRNFYQRTNYQLDINVASCIAVANNHVIVSYPCTTLTNRTWPVKNTTGLINAINIVINMANGAISFFSNMWVSNSFWWDAGNTSVLLLRGGPSMGNTPSYLASGNHLFNDGLVAGVNFDQILPTSTTCTNLPIAGPNVQFETTKLTLGNAARLKFWKMFLMNYASDVSMTAAFISSNLTAVDFPNYATGTAGVVTFPVSSNIGILKRVKFLVRTPQLAIRVYQTANASATSQRFKMFWYTVGGKWMRQGRQQ